MVRVKKTMRKRSNTKRSNTKRSKTMRSKRQTGGGLETLKTDIHLKSRDINIDTKNLIRSNYEYFINGNDSYSYYDDQVKINRTNEDVNAYKQYFIRNEIMLKDNIINKLNSHSKPKLEKIKKYLTTTIDDNMLPLEINCSGKGNIENFKCMLITLNDKYSYESPKTDYVIKETLFSLIALLALKEICNTRGIDIDFSKELPETGNNPSLDLGRSSYEEDAGGGRRKKRSKSKTRRHR